MDLSYGGFNEVPKTNLAMCVNVHGIVDCGSGRSMFNQSFANNRSFRFLSLLFVVVVNVVVD